MGLIFSFDEEQTMSWPDKMRQRLDWHRAELTPDYEKRQERRTAYDEKYDRCSHGTRPKGECRAHDERGDPVRR